MATIRKAAAKDASGIARVYIDTWRDTYAGVIPSPVLLKMNHRQRAAEWSKVIRNSYRNDTVIVAEDPDGGIIGFGSCGRVKGVKLPYEGEVYTLYVHPNFQGQGVGKSLLERLFRVLVTKGFGSALIWVLADNPARFFYQAMGGTLMAEQQGRLWGTALRKIAYGWSDLKTVVTRIEGGENAKLPSA